MTELPRDPATAAALARLYDVDLLDDPGDVDLYLATAARSGGPILELAAGSGRVAVPLAEAGYEVTAVDIDPAMLERARRRAEAAGAETCGRLELVEADLTTLRLPGGARYRLAILALNSILLLPTREAQRRAFEAIAGHLVRDGLAVVDVWLPTGSDLSRYDGRLGLEYVRTDPETGLVVTKTASAVHETGTGRVSLTTVYEEGEQGAPVRRWIRRDTLRLLGADELREMAESAGLAIELVAGTYELDSIGPYDERAILVARRRGRSGSAGLV